MKKLRKHYTEDLLAGYLEGTLDNEIQEDIRQRLGRDKNMRKTVEMIQSEEQALRDLGKELRKVAPRIYISDSVQRVIEEPESAGDAIEEKLFAIGESLREKASPVHLCASVRHILEQEEQTDFTPGLEAELAATGKTLHAQTPHVDLVSNIVHALERLESNEAASMGVHAQRKQTRNSMLSWSWITAVAAGILLCIGFLFFQLRYPLKTDTMEVAHRKEIPSTQAPVPARDREGAPVTNRETNGNSSEAQHAGVDTPAMLRPVRPTVEQIPAPVVPEETTENPAFTIEDILAAKQKALEGQADALNRLARWGTLAPDEVRQLLDTGGTTLEQKVGMSRFLPQEEAIQLLEQVVADAPENAEYRFALASQLMDSPARQEEAFQHLAVLRELAPQNALVHYMDAQLRFTAGDYAGGLSVLNDAARLNVGTAYGVQNAQHHSTVLEAAGLSSELADTVSAFYAGTDEYETISQLRTDLLEYGAGFEAAGDYETAMALYKSVEEMGTQVSRGAAYTNEYLAGLDTQMEAIQAMSSLAEQTEMPEEQQQIQRAYEVLLEGVDLFAEYTNVLADITRITDIKALLEAVRGILEAGDLQFLQRLLSR